MKKFSMVLTGGLIAVSMLVAGCSSSGGVVSDPGYGVSGKKHQGKMHRINLFGRSKPKSAPAPVSTDPEYQEYQEWKKWQEFQEYQEWKKNNPQALPDDDSTS